MREDQERFRAKAKELARNKDPKGTQEFKHLQAVIKELQEENERLKNPVPVVEGPMVVDDEEDTEESDVDANTGVCEGLLSEDDFARAIEWRQGELEWAETWIAKHPDNAKDQKAKARRLRAELLALRAAINARITMGTLPPAR